MHRVVAPQRSFAPRPESVGEARDFVRAVTPGLPGHVQDDLSLMVSELSTNAILHGGGPFVVSVDCTDHDVTVSVTDHGPGGPLLQRSSVLHPRGRGLRIVDRLADDWGSGRSTHDETVVWFRVGLAGGVG